MFIEVINEDVAFLERQYEERSSRLQELSLSKPDSNELVHCTTVREECCISHCSSDQLSDSFVTSSSPLLIIIHACCCR